MSDILVTSGRTAVAVSLIDETWHLAIGNGDVAWDTTPVAEPIAATALVAEVGRKACTQISYCEPDDEGDIELSPTEKFTLIETPSRYLYLKFTFSVEDAVTEIIRERGLFLGTVTDPELPEGQTFFEPADVVTPGLLVILSRFDRFVRSGDNREIFEYVLEI